MNQFPTSLLNRVAKGIGCPRTSMRLVAKDIAQGQTVLIKTHKGTFNVRTTDNGQGIETLKVANPVTPKS